MCVCGGGGGGGCTLFTQDYFVGILGVNKVTVKTQIKIRADVTMHSKVHFPRLCLKKPINIFLISPQKHMLWVPNRSASVRRF